MGRGPIARAATSTTTATTNGDQATKASSVTVQDRLQHLEDLVLSLSEQKQQLENGKVGNNNDSIPTTSSSTTSPAENYNGISSSSDQSSPEVQEARHAANESSGKLLVKDGGTTSYVDGSHWRGILEEVS